MNIREEVKKVKDGRHLLFFWTEMKKTTMKKSILSIILTVTALTATAQNTYTLNFDPVLLSEELAKENVKIDSFYLADFVSQEPITEKFAFKDNKIAISGKVNNPQIAALILEMKIEYGIRTNRFPLFLEAGDIVITQDDWMSCRVEGTPLNDAMFNATREIGKASVARWFNSILSNSALAAPDFLFHKSVGG